MVIQPGKQSSLFLTVADYHNTDTILFSMGTLFPFGIYKYKQWRRWRTNNLTRLCRKSMTRIRIPKWKLCVKTKKNFDQGFSNSSTVHFHNTHLNCWTIYFFIRTNFYTKIQLVSSSTDFYIFFERRKSTWKWFLPRSVSDVVLKPINLQHDGQTFRVKTDASYRVFFMHFS